MASENGFTAEDDRFYRDRYESSPRRLADRSYEEIRPAYRVGHFARSNPEYNGLDFESIEPWLRAGWTGGDSSRDAIWPQMREYARDAYSRDFSVTSREASVRDRAPDDNLADRVANADRPRDARIAGAMDDGRDDKGEDGNAEARLAIPVSRR